MKHPIIFFDGVCGLCNNIVQFVLNRDKKGLFHFSQLQSAFAQKILPQYGGRPQEMNTLYVLKDLDTDQPVLLSKSSAACYVLSQLGGIYWLLSLGIIFPRFLRDFVYDRVAKNRYRFFGKKDVCMLPQEGWMARFIEDTQSS